MKQKYNSNKKNQQVRRSNKFDGKIAQMHRNTVILVNLDESRAFAAECFRRGIKVDVGSTYKDGVIIYEKK
jgi:hypothetical protein